MFHTRCDQHLADLRKASDLIIGDLRGRLDASGLHVQQLEQDKRHLTAQLVEALKPLPQALVTDQVIREMTLPKEIDSAIQYVMRTNHGNTAMEQYLDTFARSELAQGADPSDIAERIRHGDGESISTPEAPDYLVPEPEQTVIEDDE